MRDGTLVRVINFDDSLKQFASLRVLSKYFSDFTDFCESVNDVCKEKNLIVEIEKGTDGGKDYYTDSIEFHFFDSSNTYIGLMEVVVLINADTCINEFKKRIDLV